jgi:ATP-binding cassette subfamily B protein
MKKQDKTGRVRLSRYIRPYWLYAVLSPLLMILEVAADLCLPILMSSIVDYGINDKGNIAEAPLAEGIVRFFAGAEYSHIDMIVTFGLLMLGVTLLGGFFGTLCAYTAARAAQGFGHDLRRDAFSRVMALSIEQTDSFTTGSLVTRMTNDVSIMGGSIHDIFGVIINGVIQLVMICIIICLLHICGSCCIVTAYNCNL